MQDVLVPIREGHVFEGNRSARLPQCDGAPGLRNRRRLLDHARQLLKRRACCLKHVVELRQLLHRVEELPQVEDEGGQHTKRQLALHDEVAAVEKHQRGGETSEQVDGGTERRDEAVRPDVGVAITRVDILEDRLVAGLAPERVHGADSAQRFHVVDDDQHDRAPDRAV